jgi:hypothetical protein
VSDPRTFYLAGHPHPGQTIEGMTVQSVNVPHRRVSLRDENGERVWADYVIQTSPIGGTRLSDVEAGTRESMT